MKKTYQIKKIAFSSFIFTILLFLISCNKLSSRSTTPNITTFEAMDTVMTIRTYGRKAEEANKKAKERVQQIENLISTTLSQSEVSLLNNANGKPIHVSDDTLQLATFTKNGAELTNGAFNPVLYPVTKAWGFTTKNYRVPSEEEITKLLQNTDYKKIKIDIENKTIQIPCDIKFDFGAVGKGFAGDQVIALFKEIGVKSALLDLGGNVQVLGSKTDGSPWLIGLKNPWGGEVPVAVYLKDCAMITSGGYERFFTADDGNSYIHIIHGNTGYPVQNDLVSATIITKSGLYADYLSTTLFIFGSKKATEFWRANPDFDFILMTTDKKLIYTKGLEGRISILKDFSEIQLVE